MPRDAALAALKIKPQTLYAYVSRGRIGVRPDPADPRRSLYRSDEVAALESRAARGRKTSDIASGARPNVDFALAAFARASRLPPDATFSLFLLGRSVGWAAHIFEQIATGTLIRPRARYEGPELGE